MVNLASSANLARGRSHLPVAWLCSKLSWRRRAGEKGREERGEKKRDEKRLCSQLFTFRRQGCHCSSLESFYYLLAAMNGTWEGLGGPVRMDPVNRGEIDPTLEACCRREVREWYEHAVVVLALCLS